MSETTYPCDSCKALGRIDGMLRYEWKDAREATITWLWHSTCPTPYEVEVLRRWKAVADFRPEQVTPISSVSKASPRQMELADALTRDKAVVDTHAELAKAQARIKALESDLALLTAGKDAAERMLRAEQAACVALARHGTLQLDRNWIELANEMAMYKGQPGLQMIDGAIAKMTTDLVNPSEPFFKTQAELDAYKHSLVIDFMNRFRRGAFAEIENDVDEIVVVKAQAYQMSYKVCCEVLAQRNVKLKIQRNADYQLEQDNKKAERVAKAERDVVKPRSDAPAISKKNATPEEVVYQQMLKLCKGNEVAAREMYDSLMSKKVPTPVGGKK